jgi:hypothetical protein
MGLQRTFNRNQYFALGEKPPKVLEAANEVFSSQVKGDRATVLHPTKGWRTTDAKKGRAQMVIAEQLKGIIPPTILVLSMIKLFITTGRWK